MAKIERISVKKMYLCSIIAIKDEATYPTPPSAAMGQERIRVRTGFFQHQSAEARFLLADTRGFCIILSDIKFYLLLQ